MSPAPKLRVGGLSPLSTIDWPGELVATVFTQGCPWDCHYCHNPHLLSARSDDELDWDDVLAFLASRRGLLDGVVFTGGEPTLQAALADAIAEVRSVGFRVGLHTAGPLPDKLAAVLPLVEWIGFDAKAPFADYERITRVPGSGEAARASLAMIVASGTPFEARTTVHPDLVSAEKLAILAEELLDAGVTRYAVQAFRSHGCRDGLGPASVTDSGLSAELTGRFAEFTFREA